MLTDSGIGEAARHLHSLPDFGKKKNINIDTRRKYAKYNCQRIKDTFKKY
jgi:hypothetical protein